MTGGAGHGRGRAAKIALPDEAQERSQRLWWYLLFAGILLLNGESLVAHRLSRAVVTVWRQRMLGQDTSGTARSALMDVIRQVRKRWRMKLALRGVVRFVGAHGAGAHRVGVRPRVAALQSRRHSRRSASAVGLAVFASAAWFLVRPLLRKVSDEQVALYLEEHEPTLEATIITAMEAEQTGRAHEMSPALVRGWSKRRSSAARRSTTAAASSGCPVRRYASCGGSRRRCRACSSSPLAPPTCGTRCRRCWSFRATSKRPRRIASR